MPEQTHIAAPATAADLMRPPLTTVEQQDHVAAAAYLMKHAGTTALMVLDPWTGQPAGIITEADIAHVVADGKDVNSTRIYEVMTTRPTVINTTTSVRDAAKVKIVYAGAAARLAGTPRELSPSGDVPDLTAIDPQTG
jgi:CBS domain-containing protein